MKVIGEGSITRLEKKPRSKCRKWRLRVQTDQGEKTRRFDGTYSQAQDALKEFIAELSTPACDRTFGQYASEWLRRRESKGIVSESTAHKYRDDLKVLNAEFGDERLHEIDKARVEDGFINIKYHGGKRVDVLSGTYMNQLHTLMKSVMEDAEDDGLIARNPLAKVKAPKIDTSKRRSLKRESFANFILTLDSLPLDARTVALRIAVMAGLRRGEIVALQWGDVYDGAIHVRRAYIEKARVIGGPKTAQGIRDVPITGQLEADLRKWKSIQAAKLEAIWLEQTAKTFVVASDAGTMMFPQNLGTWWSKVRGPMFGLDGILLHELRHTYLTMLASKASSQSLKDIAGWATIAMADTYVHRDEEANRQAVAELDNMIDFETARLKQGGELGEAGTSGGTSTGTSDTPHGVLPHCAN